MARLGVSPGRTVSTSRPRPCLSALSTIREGPLTAVGQMSCFGASRSQSAGSSTALIRRDSVSSENGLVIMAMFDARKSARMTAFSA